MAQVLDDGPVSAAATGSRTRWLGLAVLGLCVLVLNLDLTVLNVALAVIGRDLQATNGELQWINAAFLLTSVGLMLFAGAIGDRWGRRRTLLGGLLIFGVASVAGAWAGSPELLIASRAVQGAGVSVVMPMTMAIIPTMFGPREQGKAIGVWGGTVALGMPLGPIVGGLMLDHFWWGSVFLINVVTVIVAVPLALLWVRESRNPEPVRIDVPGVLLSVVGVGALVYATIEAQRGWSSPQTLGWFLAGVVVLAGFVLRQRTAPEPLVRLSLFAKAGFTWPLIVMNLIVFAAAGVLFLAPLYLQGVRGLDALETGLRLLPFAFTTLVGSLVSDRLATGVGARWGAAGGLVSIAAGLAALATVGPDSGDLVVYVAMGLVGLGVGLSQPAAMAVAVSSLPRDTVGSGSAVINSFRQLGGIFGVAILGTVVSALYTSSLPTSIDALPGAAAERLRASIANVLPVTGSLGERGAGVREAAFTAFTDGMSAVLICCAVVAVAAAVLAAIFLPAARHDPESPDVTM